MTRFYGSLAFKIGIAIIVVEIIVLSTLGFAYLNQFSNSVDERIEERVQIPGELMDAGLLTFDSIENEEKMRILVGEELISGLIVGVNLVIYYSLNSSDLGKSIANVSYVDDSLFNIRNPRDVVVHKDANVVSVSIIYASDRQTPRFFVYVEVGTSMAKKEKAELTQLFILGSITTVILTSAIILLSFKFLVFTRVRNTIQVLKQIQDGDLTARVDEPISHDEIGTLQLGVNSMTKKLQGYHENLEDLVAKRTMELAAVNDELKRTQEDLVKKEKLAVLGLLAGGVSHELRNPLGAIKNAIYFLNMALEAPEPDIKETLEILDKEVATSDRIISSLLDFARPKPPTFQKVEVNDTLREALSRVIVPENIEVVYQLDETLPLVQADPFQLTQVFDNIILNAIQAMPEGGQLTIISKVSNTKWLTVSVRDTGVGISEKDQSKLFEPLFTTKAKGIGLGLVITKTLVEAHSGTIEVQSELNKGSIFTVKLPISGEEQA